jgi:hypothetical protein
MNKRGVTPVVATVLLLVLTVGLAAVIFSFVIPFVNDQLGNSKACLAVLGGIEFADSKYNCVGQHTSTSYTGEATAFSIKLTKAEIEKARVSLIDSNGNSDVFEVFDGLNVLGGALSQLHNIGGFEVDEDIIFPNGIGAQRTYLINGNYEKAEISPITESGNSCDVADIVEFTPCSTDVII